MATLGNLVVGVSVDTGPLSQLTTAMRSAKTAADSMNTSVKTTDTVTKTAVTSEDKLTASAKNLASAHDSANKSAGNFLTTAGSMAKSLVLWNVGYTAIMGTISGIGAAIGGTISAGIKYQDQLNTLGAVTNATKSQMSAMSAEAIKLGEDIKLPNVSAADAADAMVELAKAGLNVNQTMAAARGTLELAAAGSIDTATAANITANALNAFHLAGNQAMNVANYLANAANASSAQVSDLGEALQDGGAAASVAKVPLQDFLAAVGELTNAGVKGSMAGTDLKTMFQRLASPTQAASDQMRAMGINAYDAQGNLLPLDNIVGQFSNSLSTMTTQQQQAALATIFGSRANQAMAILAQDGATKLDNMTAAVTRGGGAAQVAAAKSQGLGGELRGISNTIQSYALDAFMNLQPYLTDAVKWLNQLAQVAFPAIGDGFSTIGTGVHNFVGELTKFSDWTKAHWSEIKDVLDHLGGAAIGGLTLNPVAEAAGGTVGVSGIAGAVGSGVGAAQQFGSTVQQDNKINPGNGLQMAVAGTANQAGVPVNVTVAFFQTINPLLDKFDQVGPKAADTLKKFGDAFNVLGTLMTTSGTNPILNILGAISTLGVDISPIISGIQGMASPLQTFANSIGRAFSTLGSSVHKALEPLGKDFDNLGKSLKPLQPLIGPVTHALEELGIGIGIVVGAILALAAGIVVGIINGLLQSLIRVIPDVIQVIQGAIAVITGIISFIVDAFTTTVKVISDLIHGNWSQAWKDATDGVKKMGDDIGQIFQGLWDIVYGLTKGMVDGVIGFFQGLVQGIVGFAQWLYDTLVGHSIIPDLVNAIVGLFQGLYNDAWNIWNDIVNTIVNFANWVWTTVGNIFNSLGTTIHNAWSAVWHIVTDDTNSIADVIWSWGENISSFVGGIFSGLGTTIHNAISGWWGTMHNDLNWIIDRINDFIDAVDDPNKDPLAGLGFNIPKLQHFATGGIVPGMGSGDTVPAMLTPGEVVLNTSAVAGLGGAEMANKLNRGWGLGAGPNLGSLGGLVGSIGGQCLAWVSSFLPQFLGIPAAIDLLSQINSQTPKAGEVFVMGSQVGQYGHMGFVTGTNGSNVDVLDSNWNLDGVIRAHEVPGSLISGYIDTALPGGLMGILSSIGGALDPANILNGLMNDIIGGFTGGGPFAPIPGNIIKGSINNIIDKAKSIVSGVMSAIAGSAPSGGGNLSVQQMAQYWSQAGGNPGLSHTMGQIGMAESSGNAAAIGPGGSWGLWQIQPQDWGFTKTTDPLTQALDAVQIEGIQGLRAWSTYNNGSYMRYDHGGDLPPGISAVMNGTGRTETVRTASQEDELGKKLDRLHDLLSKKLMGSVTINQTQGQSAAAVMDEISFQTWATQL